MFFVTSGVFEAVKVNGAMLPAVPPPEVIVEFTMEEKVLSDWLEMADKFPLASEYMPEISSSSERLTGESLSRAKLVANPINATEASAMKTNESVNEI